MPSWPRWVGVSGAAYTRTGLPGVRPEQLLKALPPRVLCSIRSAIRMMQAIDVGFLWWWFIDLPRDAPVWTPETPSMNQHCFAEQYLLARFLDRILAEAMTEGSASSVGGRPRLAVRSCRPSRVSYA